MCTAIIKAHTITKSYSIKTVAENGHVYALNKNASHIARSGQINLKKIGVNRASTFTGFCGFHDNSTFHAIEKGEITFDSESIFLLSYRVVAHEMYLKEASMHAAKTTKEVADAGLPFDVQVKIQITTTQQIAYIEVGLNETRISKNKYDEILTSKNYDSFKWVAIRLDTQLPVLSAGAFFPDCDLDANPLYDLHETYDDPPMMVINIINDNKGSIACLGWLRNDERSTHFAENFIQKVNGLGVDFLAFFGVATLENTFYRPSWWESLNSTTQKGLKIAALSSLNGLPWHVAISNPIPLGIKGQILNIERHYNQRT